MKLSVCICSVVSRIVSRKPLIDTLVALSGIKSYIDWSDCPPNTYFTTYKGEDVEILLYTDGKQNKVGAKRNTLLRAATGKYVSMVDDDDSVSDDYISELLKATTSDADVITFNVAYHDNGKPPKPVYYDMNFGKDINEPTCYKRLPNHLMCFKREIAIQAGFPDISFGEDAAFAKRVLPLIKTQHKIDKTLYHYLFNSKTSETQRR